MVYCRTARTPFCVLERISMEIAWMERSLEKRARCFGLCLRKNIGKREHYETRNRNVNAKIIFLHATS